MYFRRGKEGKGLVHRTAPPLWREEKKTPLMPSGGAKKKKGKIEEGPLAFGWQGEGGGENTAGAAARGPPR